MRVRARDAARQQHLLAALMVEVAIGKAHAGNRTAEAAITHLVEVEAWLERETLDRCANGLTAHLERIARQSHVANRTRTTELHGAGRAAVLEHPAGAARAIEAA